MLEELSYNSKARASKTRLIQWDYIKSNVSRTIEEVLARYRREPSWIPSDHILIQYLNELRANYRSPEDLEFYYQVRDDCPSRANALNMVSSWSKGAIARGSRTFYGSDDEIHIAYTASHDVFSFKRQWKKFSPITVLRHGYDRLTYQPIDTDYQGLGNINVLLIDLVGLALQYRYFVLEDDYLVSSGIRDLPASVNDFLYKYPLANMLHSHSELVILNNFMKWSITGNFGSGGIRRRLAVDDYQRAIDTMVQKANEEIRAKGYSSLETYKTIETLYHEDIVAFYQLPEEMLINRQNIWALFYSLLPVLEYGFKVGDNPEGNTKQRFNLNKLITRLRNEKMIDYFPKELRMKVEIELSRIEDYVFN